MDEVLLFLLINLVQLENNKLFKLKEEERKEKKEEWIDFRFNLGHEKLVSYLMSKGANTDNLDFIITEESSEHIDVLPCHGRCIKEIVPDPPVTTRIHSHSSIFHILIEFYPDIENTFTLRAVCFKKNNRLLGWLFCICRPKFSQLQNTKTKSGVAVMMVQFLCIIYQVKNFSVTWRKSKNGSFTTFSSLKTLSGLLVVIGTSNSLF